MDINYVNSRIQEALTMQPASEAPRFSLALIDVADVASRNPAGIVDVSPHTVSWWRHSFRTLNRWSGVASIDDVTPALLAEWHRHTAETVSPNTANNYIRSVRIALERLVKRGVIAANPAKHVPLARERKYVPKAATYETYIAMRAACDVNTEIGVRDRAMVSFVWGTGCRIGEMTSVRPESIEFWIDDGRLCMAAEISGKYHRRMAADSGTRYAYCEATQALDVKAWLELVPMRQRYLFADNTGKKPMQSNYASQRWKKIVQHAGLDDDETANAHSFRHAFVYRKQQEGYPIAWISQWIGHSSPEFTMEMYGDRSEHESRKRFFRAAPPDRSRLR